MNSVRFGCTSLVGINKTGNLKQDKDGYYECIVGALNMYNSAGQYYVYDKSCELFQNSSQLMRRVKRGALRGEYGHPKRQISQSMDDFAHRVLSIHEEQVCCHHAELFLDFERVKDNNGSPVIAIVSKVAPSGPFGHVLERSLKNPRENVCFSIRSFTDDFMDRGVLKRTLKTVVTFDYVNEPGIAVAEKFKSPALEDLGSDVVFTRSQIRRGVKVNAGSSIAQESVSLSASELFQTMGWQADQETINAFAKAPAWKGW
jgi:hypothetical protein